MNIPNCPKCNCEYTYEDGEMYICPECAYEWSKHEVTETENIIKDSNGNVLTDGDSVTVIKDLKVKGSSAPIKQGTKIKNIKLVYDGADDGHNINCKVDGFGAMGLKSEFVKKL